MNKLINKILAAFLATILVITLSGEMNGIKNVKAEEMVVNLEPWTFEQGGNYDPVEVYDKGIINEVIMNETKEKILGWIESGEKSIGQKQTAIKVSDGFSLNIATTGYDCQWSQLTGYETDRINPWSVQAYMGNVSITPGHIYTVSFKASASKKKYAFVSFGSDLEGTTPYGSDEVKGSNQIITLTPEQKIFTYTFTNWVSAKKLTTNLMFGAFMAQYDWSGTDISDIVTETEANWSGSVYISEFKVIDHGMDVEFVTEPVRPTQSATETSTVTFESNGSNIASNNSWSWFSVCPLDGEKSLDYEHNGHKASEDGSRDNPYCWYHALTHTKDDYHSSGYIPGVDFATKGWVVPGFTVSSVQFYAANTGWDGAYNGDGLVGDNPYGLRLFSSELPVEKGRSYTLSFKYKSGIKGKNSLSEDVFQKHMKLSLINPDNNDKLEFDSNSGCSNDGLFVADAEKGEQTITVKFSIPSAYQGNAVVVDFACGAFLVTYPDELAMRGSIYIEDFQVLAGEYEEQPDPIEPQNVTVMSSAYNTISVNWSETERMKEMGQTYNVYLDGNLVMNNVNCGGYTLTNIPKGQHQIIVEALYNGKSVQSDSKEIFVAEPPTNIKETTTIKDGYYIKNQQIINAKDVVKTYGEKTFALNASTNGDGKLTYRSNNTKVVTISQTGKVSIKGCGRAVITINSSETSYYKATVKKISIIVNPRKASIKKVKSPAKLKLQINWNKDNKVTGYQVQISENKKFKKGILQRYFNKNQTKINISMRKKSGKKYYVRIRSYKRSKGIDYYGAWSKVKKVRIK